jgi:phosphoribosylformimino-5-aminoimidazole carboxamide ribotide isomerase
VRGEREHYQPIEGYSHVVTTSDPLRVLEEIRPREVYVADLNRLTGRRDNLRVLEMISKKALTMADVGISRMGDLYRLPAVVSPVLGTETASFGLMKEAAGRRRTIVSIDMVKRRVLTRDAEMQAEGAVEMLRRLNGLPLEAVILLELDRVGTASGLDGEFLQEAASVSDHALILGGGVKGVEDLQVLEGLGFAGALVATAVHNGSIPLSMVR